MRVGTAGRHNHAKNNSVGRMVLSLVPGFWDKHTMACAGAMPFPGIRGHYQDFELSSLKLHDSAYEYCIILFLACWVAGEHAGDLDWADVSGDPGL